MCQHVHINITHTHTSPSSPPTHSPCSQWQTRLIQWAAASRQDPHSPPPNYTPTPTTSHINCHPQRFILIPSFTLHSPVQSCSACRVHREPESSWREQLLIAVRSLSSLSPPTRLDGNHNQHTQQHCTACTHTQIHTWPSITATSITQASINQSINQCSPAAMAMIQVNFGL